MSGPRGRGYGRPGDRAESVPAQDAPDWFAAHVPAGWFTGPPAVVVDRDEITVVGELPFEQPPVEKPRADQAAASHPGGVAPSNGPDLEAAALIRGFRERTRDERIAIAAEAERRYGRKVAWGATAGAASELFTVLSVPVMTRLRQPERQVLDTLVESGVARSRSEALAWCVRLVGDNSDTWLRQLREALEQVEKIRAEGPGR
ncbi:MULTISPECIES: hypothetical protein [Frankia]|uniref:Uncharacterized protein n=1 Tax=Frankia alni (strain DSM 45986 / CECT 9034 / ACN14a) TaxID=326424 RepID=Q0RCJ4_FRAAA|nr:MULTISPECIES: hypothetical protein [Frankia]CAJ64830.1 Conserved hypothetical protein [Frankia alni ACN14a]